MDCEDNDSGDESSTSPLGDERSIALLPGVNKVKVCCGNGGKKGGGGGKHSATTLVATENASSTSCARLSTSSDPAAAECGENEQEQASKNCYVQVSNEHLSNFISF